MSSNHHEPVPAESARPSRRNLLLRAAAVWLTASSIGTLDANALAGPPKKPAAKPRKSRGKSTKKPPASQPAPTPPVIPPPETETIEAAVQRLNRITTKQVTREEVAWRTGLAFFVALGKSQTEAGLDLIDAAGYQPLPWTGELPEAPAKPLAGAGLRDRFNSARHIDWAHVTLNHFALLNRGAANDKSATIASWMLSDSDRLLCYTPPATDAARDFDQPAAIVIRLRAKRATVVAGTVLPGN